jgi:hypothetical protein
MWQVSRRSSVCVQIPLFFFGVVSEAEVVVTTYLDVLKNFVPLHIEQKYTEVFQHGDAVVPLNNFVRAALNGKFPVCSVRRGRLVSWTPKSLDLMPVGLRLRGI